MYGLDVSSLPLIFESLENRNSGVLVPSCIDAENCTIRRYYPDGGIQGVVGRTERSGEETGSRWTDFLVQGGLHLDALDSFGVGGPVH